MKKLSLGFSPCPNDTFIFDAMLHGRIDTEGLEFEVFMEDVEALNRRAFAGDIAVTKLSYHAFAYLTDRYALLDSGSALGNRCGPLLIARAPMDDDAVNAARIAIPGKMTTANFLLSLAYPDARNKQECLFSEIEGAVLAGEADAGLIIHENRFTYQQKGLLKLMDLGDYWETGTGLPIPLGGIVVRRDLNTEVQQKVNRVLRRSVEYAFAHPDEVMPFVRRHAQAMEDAVMQAHIDLYVTDFTVDLGEKGRRAVQEMFRIAREKHIIPLNNDKIFIN
ncbi:MAG: 1,4-dihydroxy-6-naphthoate synthase [Lewinellaceae bacterium]|nr:1,4-dihydroxy-6-naphthoate synthase [Lewinellaceae bacterium]